MGGLKGEIQDLLSFLTRRGTKWSGIADRWSVLEDLQRVAFREVCLTLKEKQHLGLNF